ncbi:MAG: hypothetical protein BAJALOKI2v1_270035 [Promethearchaeota archaeon]|nr:MAG: hypothetical protein BAJALOKI2v1_270035 [Candidatus Lokiarchaeota archaeon]
MLITDDKLRQVDLLKLVRISKKISNEEFKLMIYFFQKTKIVPVNVILLKEYSPFIFFFVNKKDFNPAKQHINRLRRDLPNKVLIIRVERTLKDLIYSFFPDLTISDLKINGYDGDVLNIQLFFKSFKERGIAIGRNGDYIKTVNLLLNDYVSISNCTETINVECKTE